MPITDLHFGQFNNNDSVFQIQSFVMFIGFIQVITNALRFYAIASEKRGFISLSRSMMNEIVEASKCSVEVLLRRSGWGVRAV